MFQIWKNEFLIKKMANPFEGNYKAYYSLVNSGKSNKTTHGDRYDENRPYFFLCKGSIFCHN
jgi:hypothetical protein